MKDRLHRHDGAVVGRPWGHYFRLVIYLYIFWLIITGSYTPKFLIMGAVAVFVVAWVCTPIFYIDNRTHTKHYFMLDIPLHRLLLYGIWLLKELILANLDVGKTLWKKQLPIQPELLHFRVDYDNPIALALLANSITLTPGTITLNVAPGNIYEIHALTPGAAQGIQSGAMARKVAWLFGVEDGFLMLPTPCPDCPVCALYEEDIPCE